VLTGAVGQFLLAGARVKVNFVANLEVFPGPAIKVRFDVLRHERVVLPARNPIPNFGFHATMPGQATCVDKRAKRSEKAVKMNKRKSEE
jgi:hypothetical protein